MRHTERDSLAVDPRFSQPDCCSNRRCQPLSATPA